MAGILDDQTDVLVLSKLDPSSYVCGRAYVDRIVHEISKRALCRLRCIRAT